MLKKQYQQPLLIKLQSAPAILGVSLLALVLLAAPGVRADKFDDQINSLKSQNNSNQATLNVLNAQAATYQGQIAALQSQIATLEGQISANEAKQADLQNQIAAKQAELEQQRTTLGAAVKQMYVDDQMSTIEMLATSKNLSDYVDKQEYSSVVQAQITKTMDAIAKLQAQLEQQKTEVDNLLNDQKAQQEQLSSSQSQLDGLLALTQSQQADYNSKIAANNSQISQLKKEQAAENARLFAGNGSYIVAGNNGDDTYPNNWRNIAQDSTIDSWGMFNRECVSYTAWKVYESGRHMPYWGGHGNANQWDDNARAAGIPVSTTPRAGDVAIKNSQPYGHAMYVEKVYSDGAIYVSQYNQDLTGHYSEAYLSADTVSSFNLQFIHF